jgi:hypothetical protein
MSKNTKKRIRTLKKRTLKKRIVTKKEETGNIAKLYKTYGSNTSNIAFF